MCSRTDSAHDERPHHTRQSALQTHGALCTPVKHKRSAGGGEKDKVRDEIEDVCEREGQGKREGEMKPCMYACTRMWIWYALPGHGLERGDEEGPLAVRLAHLRGERVRQLRRQRRHVTDLHRARGQQT